MLYKATDNNSESISAELIILANNNYLEYLKSNQRKLKTFKVNFLFIYSYVCAYHYIYNNYKVQFKIVREI